MKEKVQDKIFVTLGILCGIVLSGIAFICFALYILSYDSSYYCDESKETGFVMNDAYGNLRIYSIEFPFYIDRYKSNLTDTQYFNNKYVSLLTIYPVRKTRKFKKVSISYRDTCGKKCPYSIYEKKGNKFIPITTDTFENDFLLYHANNEEHEYAFVFNERIGYKLTLSLSIEYLLDNLERRSYEEIIIRKVWNRTTSD
jgi:hypothetical protein